MGKVFYVQSLIYMVLILFIRVLIFLIMHKIQTGKFIGDIPTELIYILFFIPVAIVIIGWTMIKICKKY